MNYHIIYDTDFTARNVQKENKNINETFKRNTKIEKYKTTTNKNNNKNIFFNW